jgi:hypothetical protein
VAFKVNLPGGGSFFVDDLTLDEVCVVEDETGESWLRMNPARSARQARAIMCRFLARSKGDAEARKILGALKVSEVAAAITVVDDDRPSEYDNGSPVVDPKEAGAEPATT